MAAGGLNSDVRHRLDAVVNRSLPLWSSARRKRPVAETDQLVYRWAEVLGGPAKLRRRLVNCGLDPDPALHLEGRCGVGGAEPWVWSAVLSEAVSSGSAGVVEVPPPNRDPAAWSCRRAIPFADAFGGLLATARRRLATRCPQNLGVLAPTALTDAEHALVEHLSYVSSYALALEWYQFRFSRAPAAALERAWSAGPASSRLYEEFIRDLRGDGLLAFFERYPVLGRILCQSTVNWVDGVAELCDRFERDCPTIREELGLGLTPGRGDVTGLRMYQSDRHHGGRAVAVLHLAEAECVIYKPRSLAPERALQSFLDTLNDDGLPLELALTPMLDRTTHGWSAFVPSARCTTRAATARYFRRAGQLLCVLHVLGVTDIHHENLIAAGEHPVVIDAEMLLDTYDDPDSAQAEGNARRLPSVHRTGMLPTAQGADRRRRDLSALAPRRTDEVAFDVPTWSNVNSDQMLLLDHDDASTAPRLAASAPFDHLDQILQGFRETHHLIRLHASRTSCRQTLLDVIDEACPRVLIRNTETYAAIQHDLLKPQLLRDGLAWSIELEWLAKPLSGPRLIDPAAISIYRTERLAMEQLDIPHFRAGQIPPSGPRHDGSELATLFARSRDSSTFIANLASLDDHDLARQLDDIRTSLGSAAP